MLQNAGWIGVPDGFSRPSFVRKIAMNNIWLMAAHREERTCNLLSRAVAQGRFPGRVCAAYCTGSWIGATSWRNANLFTAFFSSMIMFTRVRLAGVSPNSHISLLMTFLS